jgi:hypothetical protein
MIASAHVAHCEFWNASRYIFTEIVDDTSPGPG